MILLALETATDTCGVALLEDGATSAQAHLHRPRVHSKRLTPLVEDVMAHAEVEASDLDVVAVSMGPGSYTGLRIGVSTAKGWALAAGADLVGVPTLEAYVAQVGPFVAAEDVICVLFDARRDEVYAGAFRKERDDLTPHAATKALPVDDLHDWLGDVRGRVWLVGDGAEKARSALEGVGAGRTLVSPSDVSPSAAWVGRRGLRRLSKQGPDDLANFEPFYVKDVHATPAPSPFA